MKMDIYCVRCIISQMVELIKILRLNKEAQERLMREVLKVLSVESYDVTSPELAEKVYDLVRQLTGREDPYAEIKREENRRAQEMVAPFRERLEELSLEDVLKLSVLGNSMDYGTEARFDVERELEELKRASLPSQVLGEFEKELQENRKLLIIGDNAGEIVFDKLLVEYLRMRYGVETTYAVRGGPIINDATMEDALQVGMDKVAKVITTGQNIAGLVLERASEEIKKAIREIPLVLSKGQGNFETLEDKGLDIYFLFRVKCPVVGAYLKKRVGEMVFIRR